MAAEADRANVKLMRAAMMATFTEKGFREERKSRGSLSTLCPKSGEDLIKAVSEVYNSPKETRDRLTRLCNTDESKR